MCSCLFVSLQYFQLKLAECIVTRNCARTLIWGACRYICTRCRICNSFHSKFYERFRNSNLLETWNAALIIAFVRFSNLQLSTLKFYKRCRDKNLLQRENQARTIYTPGGVVIYCAEISQTVSEYKFVRKVEWCAHYCVCSGFEFAIIYVDILQTLSV